MSHAVPRGSVVCMVQATSSVGSRTRYLRMRRTLRTLRGQLPSRLVRAVMLFTCYVTSLIVYLLSRFIQSTLN